MKKIVTILVLFISIQQLNAQVTVSNLRCEMLLNPQGIDVKQPRLSWQLQSAQRNVVQTSYQLLVSSSVQNLQQNKGDVWNSGKINK